MNIKRIALKENITRGIFRSKTFDLAWRWWDINERTGNTPFERVYIKHGGKTSIHYIEDFFIETSYILTKGEEVDLVIEEAKSNFDCYSWQEIIDEYTTNEDIERKIKLIHLAGVTAPYGESDPGYKKFFDDCLKDKNPQIRKAVILAMGYMSWQEWKEVLNDLQQEDPDLEVSESAFLMLESFEKAEREKKEIEQQEGSIDENEDESEIEEIKKLKLSVPVIVAKNSVKDRVLIKCKIKNQVIRDIYLQIGTAVTVDQVEDHIKFIDLFQRLSRLSIKTEDLKNRNQQWIDRYEQTTGKLDKNSKIIDNKRELANRIEEIGYTCRELFIGERLEELINRFNGYGNVFEIGILNYTAKMIKDKVPEKIEKYMKVLSLWHGVGSHLDLVSEDPDGVMEDVFEDLIDFTDFIEKKICESEQVLISIEKDPEKGYSIEKIDEKRLLLAAKEKGQDVEIKE